MRAKTRTRQAGFTLLEVMIAAAIFLIGILALYGMQLAAIKENLSANTITTGSTWATDRVEQLLGLDYGSLNDTNNDGCFGITTANRNDIPFSQIKTLAPPDGSVASGTATPVYNIYWYVADNCVLKNLNQTSTNNVCSQYRPKTIRVIVTKVDGSGQEMKTAVFDYIKQNARCKN